MKGLGYMGAWLGQSWGSWGPEFRVCSILDVAVPSPPTRYNITHMVLDDSDQRRWDVTLLNAYARRSATNGPYSVYRVVPQKYIEPTVVRFACLCLRFLSLSLSPCFSSLSCTSSLPCLASLPYHFTVPRSHGTSSCLHAAGLQAY